MRYKKIDRRNLKTHINLTVGSLYSRPIVKKKEPKPSYSPVFNGDYTQLYEALKTKQIEMIWIEGPAIPYPDIEE